MKLLSRLLVSNKLYGNLLFSTYHCHSTYSYTSHRLFDLSDARAPNLPEGHHTAELSPTTALIQWTVPSIAYTPETYVVEYGTSQDNLHIARGESLTSGDDIKAVGKVHTLELTGLSPGTKYYFVVAAYNSEKLSKTNPTFFYTVETGAQK